MRIVTSSKPTGLFIFFCLVTLGAYWLFSKLNESDEEKTDSPMIIPSSANDSPIESESLSSRDGSISKPGTNALSESVMSYREQKATIHDLEQSKEKDLIRYDPLIKGFWKDKTGLFTDRFTGKTYKKDSSPELILKNVEESHYKARYMGDIIWIPASLISINNSLA